MKDERAFPSNEMHDSGEHWITHLGLTKREYFAAKAMQGLLASCACQVSHPHTLAPDAVRCADALIAELAKETP